MKRIFSAFFGISSSFLILLILFLLFFNLSNDGFFKAVFFTCTTWESEINKKEPSKIYPRPPSNFLVIPTKYFKNYETNTFFWENFKNEKKDFLKLDSLLKSISNQSLYLNEKSSSKFNDTYLLNFCWNNKEIISRKVDIREDDHLVYLGLFSLTYKSILNNYLIVNFSTSQISNLKIEPFLRNGDNLNLHNIEYDFKTKGEKIIVDNCNEFNFVFWKQAQEFLEKKYGKSRFGNKYTFYHQQKMIAKFDFAIDGGYKIELAI